MDRRQRASDAYRKAASRPAGGPPKKSSPPRKRAASGPKIDPAGEGPPPDADSGFQKTGSVAATGSLSALVGRGSVDRAARLLIAMGTDRAADVMAHLDEPEVEQLARSIIQIKTVRRSEIEQVERPGIDADRPLTGGADVARAMLIAAFGEDEGERRFFRSVPNAPAHHFEFLNALEPSQLRAALKDESAAATALVLAHVDRKSAAGVLVLLDAERRAEVAKRIARMGRLGRDTILRVEEALREKIRHMGTHRTESVGGTGSLAAILRHMAPSLGDTIIAELEAADVSLGSAVKDELYTVDLLERLSPRNMADVLREWSERDIALLLKGKSEELRALVLRSVSERRSRDISEEYAHLGVQKREDVDRITREVLERVRALEEEGSLLVPREGERYI